MKRHCKFRAEWQIQFGKPTARLSSHYRLNCDYKTAVMTCWEEGGSEPLYLCERHAKELGQKAAAKPLEGATEIPPTATAGTERLGADAREAMPRIAQRSDRVTGELSEGGGKAKKERHAEILEISGDHGTRSGERAPGNVQRDASIASLGPSIAAEKPSSGIEPKAAHGRESMLTKTAAARHRVRDFTYGNPAKAMVDEAIWNMGTGNWEAYRSALRQGRSAMEAAQAAGGQLAVVHRRIAEYGAKVEALLSESAATLNVRDTIDKPLEQAMLAIIANGTMNDAEKDATMQQLGGFEEWVKHGLKDTMTPLEANRIMVEIGDHLNWGGNDGVSEGLRAAYGALYGSLKRALYMALPEAQNLHERLTNLNAAKAELENSPVARELDALTA